MRKPPRQRVRRRDGSPPVYSLPPGAGFAPIEAAFLACFAFFIVLALLSVTTRTVSLVICSQSARTLWASDVYVTVEGI